MTHRSAAPWNVHEAEYRATGTDADKCEGRDGLARADCSFHSKRSPRDWLIAGITHVIVLPAVTASGLTTDDLNQPNDVERLRPKLKNLVRTLASRSFYFA